MGALGALVAASLKAVFGDRLGWFSVIVLFVSVTTLCLVLGGRLMRELTRKP